EAWRGRARLRLIVLATRAALSYVEYAFGPGDVLLFGRESAGVAGAVHAGAAARLKSPMRPALRSRNVAVAAAMGVREARRRMGPLERIKLVANKRDVPYQSLIKIWLAEKAETE